MGTQLEARLADFEAGEALGSLVEDLDALDAGSSRSFTAKGHHRLDRLLFAFEDRLDRAVGAIPDPTGDAVGVRLAPRRLAEEDALDAPVDDRPSANAATVASASHIRIRARCSPRAGVPQTSLLAMGRRHLAAVALTLALGSLVVVPGAVAATEVGNECAASGYAADFTLLQLERAPGSLLPLAAPAGVVTEWKVDSGLASILAENLRVFRPTGKPDEFEAVADSPNEPILPGANAFKARIPVRAGDRFGAYAPSPSGALYCNSASAADVMGAVHFDSGVGSTQVFTPNPSFQVALSAIVEPDADGDGYGDQTQDRCPRGRAYHGECPRVRLHAFAKARRRAILLLVTASSAASVHVYGQVGSGVKRRPSQPGGRGERGAAIFALSGGTKHIGTGATTRFRIPLPKGILRRLDGLPASASLIATITASSTDLAGRVRNHQLKVRLRGRVRT